MVRFSERFGKLCDEAGFIKGRGRMSEVARFFDTGTSTARNWLVENKCPRGDTLDKLIRRLKQYRRLPESLDTRSLVIWLRMGEAYVASPFKEDRRGATKGSLVVVMRQHPELREVFAQHGLDLTQLPLDARTEKKVVAIVHEAMSAKVKTPAK